MALAMALAGAGALAATGAFAALLGAAAVLPLMLPVFRLDFAKVALTAPSWDVGDTFFCSDFADPAPVLVGACDFVGGVDLREGVADGDFFAVTEGLSVERTGSAGEGFGVRVAAAFVLLPGAVFRLGVCGAFGLVFLAEAFAIFVAFGGAFTALDFAMGLEPDALGFPGARFFSAFLGCELLA